MLSSLCSEIETDSILEPLLPNFINHSRNLFRKSHPSGIVPTLQNIVSTVNLDCKLDLKAIALQARNAKYNPKGGNIQAIVEKN
ncbi:hypothetical protein L6452_14116 [Arctium lappa]|uniref:Uncharacterized protein n=1 Tax=Arctium lappa TaxID=4217 RepID=A0ACB9CK37_ARCLA|nr:hypothetical protein L6452_14116 [Arctium lappa]